MLSRKNQNSDANVVRRSSLNTRKVIQPLLPRDINSSEQDYKYIKFQKVHCEKKNLIDSSNKLQVCRKIHSSNISFKQNICVLQQTTEIINKKKQLSSQTICKKQHHEKKQISKLNISSFQLKGIFSCFIGVQKNLRKWKNFGFQKIKEQILRNQTSQSEINQHSRAIYNYDSIPQFIEALDNLWKTKIQNLTIYFFMKFSFQHKELEKKISKLISLRLKKSFSNFQKLVRTPLRQNQLKQKLRIKYFLSFIIKITKNRKKRLNTKKIMMTDNEQYSDCEQVNLNTLNTIKLKKQKKCIQIQKKQILAENKGESTQKKSYFQGTKKNLQSFDQRLAKLEEIILSSRKYQESSNTSKFYSNKSNKSQIDNEDTQPKISARISHFEQSINNQNMKCNNGKFSSYYEQNFNKLDNKQIQTSSNYCSQYRKEIPCILYTSRPQYQLVYLKQTIYRPILLQKVIPNNLNNVNIINPIRYQNKFPTSNIRTDIRISESLESKNMIQKNEKSRSGFLKVTLKQANKKRAW